MAIVILSTTTIGASLMEGIAVQEMTWGSAIALEAFATVMNP